MPLEVLHVELQQGLLQGLVALRVVSQRLRGAYRRLEQAQQGLGKAADAVHPAVVREVHRLRCTRHQALNGGFQRLGLELHWRGRGHDPRTLGAVELAIAQAESVSGEPAARGFVPDAVVVPCMTRSVDQGQGAACQLHRHLVNAGDHALGSHTGQLAVSAVHLGLPVHGERALVQGRGVDHVPCAAGVHQQLRVRQRLHQQAHTPSVVQMHMGRDHPIDGAAGQAQRLQGLQQTGHAEIGAGVDEGGAAALHDQVGRIEVISVKAGVDGKKALAQRYDEGRQHHQTIVGIVANVTQRSRDSEDGRLL